MTGYLITYSKRSARKQSKNCVAAHPFCDIDTESDGKCENAERENLQETRGGSGELTQPRRSPKRCMKHPSGHHLGDPAFWWTDITFCIIFWNFRLLSIAKVLAWSIFHYFIYKYKKKYSYVSNLILHSLGRFENGWMHDVELRVRVYKDSFL